MQRLNRVWDGLNCFSCVGQSTANAPLPSPPSSTAAGEEVIQTPFQDFVQKGSDTLKKIANVGQEKSLLTHVASNLSFLLSKSEDYRDYANRVCVFLSPQCRELSHGVFDSFYRSLQNPSNVITEEDAACDRFKKTLSGLDRAHILAGGLASQERGKGFCKARADDYLCKEAIRGTLRKVIARINRCGLPLDSLLEDINRKIHHCEGLPFSDDFFTACSAMLDALAQAFFGISEDAGQKGAFNRYIRQAKDELEGLKSCAAGNRVGDMCIEEDEVRGESLNQTMHHLESIVSGLDAMHEQICLVQLLSKHALYPILLDDLSQLLRWPGFEKGGVKAAYSLIEPNCTISTFVCKVANIAAEQQQKTEAWKTRWEDIAKGASPSRDSLCRTGRALGEIIGGFERMYLQLCWAPALDKMRGLLHGPFLYQMAERIQAIIDCFHKLGVQDCIEEMREELKQCIRSVPDMSECTNLENWGQEFSGDAYTPHCELAKLMQALAGDWDQKCRDRMERGGGEDFSDLVFPPPRLYLRCVNSLMQSLEKLGESSVEKRRRWARNWLDYLSLHFVEQSEGQKARRLVRLFASLWEVNEDLRTFDLRCGGSLHSAWFRHDIWQLNSENCHTDFTKCVTNVLAPPLLDGSIQQLVLDTQRKLNTVHRAYVFCKAQCVQYNNILHSLSRSNDQCMGNIQELLMNLEELICAIGDLQCYNKIKQNCEERDALCCVLCEALTQEEQTQVQDQNSLLKETLKKCFVLSSESSPPGKALQAINQLTGKLDSSGQHERSRGLHQLRTAHCRRRHIAWECQNDVVRVAINFGRAVALEGVG